MCMCFERLCLYCVICKKEYLTLFLEIFISKTTYVINFASITSISY